jgi:hypothetical protein
MRTKFFALLFLALPFSAKSSDGDSIWKADFIHDLYFNFSQTGYWDTLLANHTADVYTSCEMIIDGRIIPSTGIKMKGNSSFNNPSNKKSFKVDLNEFVAGQDYDGIKKFNLNNGFKDPTFMREKIMCDFMNRHGMVAPQCTYARVYLNNVYWGLYMLVEEVSSTKFLKQRYPDNDGNLFKGDPTGDMKWYGSLESSYYSHYTLETNETENDWSDLVHFLDIGNNTPTATYYDSLEAVIEPWSFFYYFAACNIFANLDSYIGSGHNYFLYHDSTTLEFHMIPWDVNEAFGCFNMNMTIAQLQTLSYDYLSQPTNRPVANKMFADPTFHAGYIAAYCDLMQDFSNSYLDPIIDSLYNKIKVDVYADNMKFYTNQNFEDNIDTDLGQTPGLKSFITARRASLISQLSAYGCWLTVEEQASAVTELITFPNPAGESTTILLPSSWSGQSVSVQLADALGKTYDPSATHNGDQLQIDLTGFANGIYFVTVVSENGLHARTRISVQH